MNYSHRLSKNIIYCRKIRKPKSILSISILGVVIGSVALTLLSKNCYKKIEDVNINNVEDNKDDSNKDINASTYENIKQYNNINTNEIVETLKHVDKGSLGDVGLAMENAIEELE